MYEKLQLIQLLLATANDSSVLNQVKALLMSLKTANHKAFSLTQDQWQEVEIIKYEQFQIKWNWKNWNATKKVLADKITE